MGLEAAVRVASFIIIPTTPSHQNSLFKILLLSLIPLDYPVFVVLVSAGRKGLLCRCNWCKWVNVVLNVHRNHEAYWGRGKERGKGVWRWGKRKIIYLSLHCHNQNDSCVKMGSDESHFNVPLLVRDKVTETTTILKKKKSSGETYQPNTLQLSQTSSQ